MGGEIRRNNEVSFWQASMRAALFNGVTEADMVEIIAAVVKQAKAGDLKAADFLFRWTIGQQPTVRINQTVIQQPDGQTIVDVAGREPGDPSPDEIAAKTLKMRDERAGRKRGLMG